MARLIQKLIVFFLSSAFSCCLLSPTLLCGGKLVGPPFPEIDYVSDEEGIATSINTETQKPQMDFGRNVVEVPGNTQTPVVDMEEKDRETLANAKFDLCCRQAGITCVECRYGVSPSMGCAMGIMAEYLTCANDGEDNSQCCESKGVASGLTFNCVNICKPEFRPLSPFYRECQDEVNFNKIKQCMVGAYDGQRKTGTERFNHCTNPELCLSDTEARP